MDRATPLSHRAIVSDTERVIEGGGAVHGFWAGAQTGAPGVPAGLLAQVPDAHVSIDLDGRVLSWNDAAVAMFGWTRAEVLGRDLGDLLLNPRRADLHRRQVGDFRATRVSDLLGRHRDVPMSTRDGRAIRVDCLVWAAEAAGGLETGSERPVLHALLDDVTDRYAAALDAQRAAEDVEAFSAAMAHDLRVPLSIIKGYVELVRDVAGESGIVLDGVDLPDRIDRAADRGVALIEDILRYLGIGRVLPDRTPVDLTALVEQVVDDQRRAAPRAARVEIRPLGTVPGDERLLRQLFGNLVGNALKHVPADRVVELVVDAAPSRWGATTVRVADNGEPLPEHDRQRVFGMFQRGATSLGTVAGSGVGLAVSQRIAELHDGGIELDASPTGGNRFCVRLGLPDG